MVVNIEASRVDWVFNLIRKHFSKISSLCTCLCFKFFNIFIYQFFFSSISYSRWKVFKVNTYIFFRSVKIQVYKTHTHTHNYCVIYFTRGSRKYLVCQNFQSKPRYQLQNLSKASVIITKNISKIYILFVQVHIQDDSMIFKINVY